MKQREMKKETWMFFSLATMVVLSCTKPTPPPVTVETPGTRLASTDAVAKVFPHSQKFKTTFLHGTEFFKDKKVCAQCHGIDFAGGSINKSCMNCHPYPHQPRWAFPSNHGHTFTGGQREACLKCHGEKSAFKERHAQEFVSCGTCHPLLPHSQDFMEGGDDHYKLAKTYEGKCTTCHTDLKRNMPSMGEDGCYMCHSTDEIPIMKWQKKP